MLLVVWKKGFYIFLDPDDPYKLTEDTRSLGLVVCRGTSVVLICPSDGMEAIANPFIQQEGWQSCNVLFLYIRLCRRFEEKRSRQETLNLCRIQFNINIGTFMYRVRCFTALMWCTVYYCDVHKYNNTVYDVFNWLIFGYYLTRSF